MLELGAGALIGAIVAALLADSRRPARGSGRGTSVPVFGIACGAILGAVCAGSISTPPLASGANAPASATAADRRDEPLPPIVDLQAATDLDATIRRARVPVLVDFWASWCGPCRRQGRILHAMEATLRGRATVIKVNVDRHRAVARQFGVRGIPALFLFRDGHLQQRLVGVQSQRRLTALLGL